MRLLYLYGCYQKIQILIKKVYCRESWWEIKNVQLSVDMLQTTFLVLDGMKLFLEFLGLFKNTNIDPQRYTV